MAGEMVHLEIFSDDTEKSRSFWGSLFGWQFEQYPGPTEYHMARIDERSGVAISKEEAGRRGTRITFDMEDINAGIARVKELGGEATDRRPVPSMGWFSVCKDTEGNEFGLWQTDPSAPAPSS
jgi:uncharacterized protein